MITPLCYFPCQLFHKNNEEYSDAMTVRALFEKVKHHQLSTAVGTLRVQTTMDPRAVTFTTASNHLASEVSQMLEYATNKRAVSVTGTIGTVSGQGIY